MLAFFAVLFGLAGTYALRNSFRQEPVVIKEELPPPPEVPVMITVPMASRDIPSGTQIVMDDVALFRMSRGDVKKHIPAKNFMANPQQIIGKIVLNDIKRGSTFDTRDFFPDGRSPGIASRLKPGERAMTIRVSPINALIGFAGPGQRVDVLFHYGESDSTPNPQDRGRDNSQTRTDAPSFVPQHFAFNPPRNRDYWGNTVGGGGGPGGGGGGLGYGGAYQSATATLIQDAEILALERNSIPTRDATGVSIDEKVSVTLAVKPAEAELLRVADGHGELSLTLRGPDDKEKVDLVGPVTLDRIIKVKDEVHKMEIYRGQQVSTLNFQGQQTIQQQSFSNQPNQATVNSNNQQNRGPGQYSSPVPNFQPTFIPVPYPVSTSPQTGQPVPGPFGRPPVNNQQRSPR